MAMSDWMQSVTGRTNAEHQAWRDNYNGGWAAGDITGNVNRAIAWERAASGEDNKEIRDLLPAGLTPEMISGKTTSNHNRGGSSAGGSGGQGASPSQSGKPAGGGNAPASPKSSALPNIPASRLGAFGTTTNPDLFGKLFVRGSTQHPMDDLEKHGQMVINGHKVTHDKGFSPAMIVEDIYGELVAAVYGAVKIGADWNATVGLDKALDAQRNPWEQLGRDFKNATVQAYQDAEKHWNATVQWGAENIPKGYESTPGNANPYAGNSPWSAPFN